MSKEYWAQVLEFESSPEMSDRYKHLEGLYKDCWRDRSMLAELNLHPIHIETPQNKASIERIKLPSIDQPKATRRRLSLIDLPNLITSVFNSNLKSSRQSQFKRRNPIKTSSRHSSLSRKSQLIQSSLS
jgi:hypothetical protein